MATKVKAGASGKGSNKRSTKSDKSGPSSKNKKKTPIKTAATQHKPKPASTSLKKKPPHMRYTEKQLKVPQLNGIKPTGVQKLPDKKKGKVFVDDGEGMRTILAMVMAEKEGNIESKMMRSRQMEEIREARRAEAEKRAEGKKAGLEERKEEIRQRKNKKQKPGVDEGVMNGERVGDLMKASKKPKKKVSFG